MVYGQDVVLSDKIRFVPTQNGDKWVHLCATMNFVALGQSTDIKQRK